MIFLLIKEGIGLRLCDLRLEDPCVHTSSTRDVNKRLYEEKVIINGIPHMSEYRRHVKRAVNRAFVPPADVPAAWEEISAEFTEDLDDFITYFERTWVGRRGRMRPKYPIERWNQVQRARVLGDRMTTINNVEGFHHAFINL